MDRVRMSTRLLPAGHRVGGVQIGLTGGIGAGKTAVARRFAELGALVIDADALAREVVAAGTPGLDAVVAEFGPGVLRPDGELDRPALGRLVFADEEARGRLNAIVHPLVRRGAAELIAAAPAGSVVVQDVPLLVETGQAGRFDLVVVVEAPAALRAERLARDRGMSADEARSWMAAQASDEQRRAVAHVVLVNDGSPDELRAEVDRVWRERVLTHR
jgi:dephospho-CoA kinase